MRHALLLLPCLLAALAAGEAMKPPGSVPLVAPPGFTAVRLATAPALDSPTCLAALPDGSGVFVGEDAQNVRAKTSGTGRVHLFLDADGDGTVERRTVFAAGINGPRGLLWSDGTLFVVAAPHLLALRDGDGDGIADSRQVLVEDLGEAPEVRPPDHTVNGVRLGIDGWLYVAVGDQGIPVDARGRDGSRVGLGCGGIIRLRPDGTRLEIVATGMRNVYDVAITPTVDLFVRENTIDGGGWNVYLFNPVPGSDAGYPARFRAFADECLPPLNDYGGGAGTGALFVDEPAVPEAARGLLTCDFGKRAIYRHAITRSGAGHREQQSVLMPCDKPTDLDVDHRGRLWLSEWGNFAAGPHKTPHGTLWRLDPTAGPGPALPDLAAADDAALVRHLAAPGQVLRLAAQRVILRRGARPDVVEALAAAAADPASPLAARVAALYTCALLDAPAGEARLAAWTRDAALREHALRALADRCPVQPVDAAPFRAALADPEPRVRLLGVIGLDRLRQRDAAPLLLAAVRDGDVVVRHAAINALRDLDVVDACLAAARGADAAAAAAALHVLRGCQTRVAVDGVAALAGATTDAARLAPVVETLGFLAKRERDPRPRWWSTRPSTKGAWYDPTDWDGTATALAALDALSARGGAAADLVKAARARFALAAITKAP